MTSLPQTYDDWLALSEEERKRVKLEEWNAYERDGIAFAFMAATRLAMQCEYKVLEIQIGTFHGGEYLLHLAVSNDDYQCCPGFLEQTFEGFRVVWFPERFVAFEPSAEMSIAGKWTAVESTESYEFDFTLTRSGVTVVGYCQTTHESLQISNPVVNTNGNRQYVYFDAYHPTFRKTTRHVFQLVAADRCEDMVTKYEYYARSQSGDATMTG